MRRTHYFPSMVQAITVLTVLKMLTNAQTTCNQGIGRVVYERLPDQQLQGFDDDVLRDTSPPWEVLSKCQDLCLKDRTSSNNLVRVCSSFDFLPGARLTSFGSSAAYEESKCYLTREQAQPEGIGTLALVPKSVHFTEVCLSSSRVETECPQRRYVFERHPRKALRLETPDFKEVRAANRSDCEDKCLNEYGFVCRSVTYDSTAMTCSLSRFTRRTHPQFFMDSPNSDYLENTCLNGERRCDATAIFVKEETKRLAGPWEAASLANTSLEDCQAECVSGAADKFFCRAIHYDENTRVCSLLEEDSFSQGEPQASASPTHHLYDLICLDNAHPFRAENSATSHLFSHGRRPDTAFQRYRNSRLGGDFHSEITGQSLSECLDECLRQTSFACRSAVYSERFRNCRLSRFSQKDGHRVIYDADYDYYENLMAHYPESDPVPGYRPDPLGQDSQFPSGRPPYSPTGGLGTNQVGIYSSPGSYGSPHVGTVGHGANAIGYHVDAYGQPLAPVGPVSAGAAPGLLPTYSPNPYLYGHNGLSPAGYAPGPHPQGPGAPPGGYNDPFYGSASRPEVSRCEEGDSFRQVGSRVRARRPYVRKFLTAPNIASCERECSDARDFMCRSFNFRPYTAAFGGGERENCELSDRDSRQLDVSSPTYFENSPDFDFYERFNGRTANQAECLDVSQVCSEDGMVFTLRTPDRFFGRIYTHGYYERCFFRGNGGFVSVFRINGAKGFPDCGTQRYGDTMTNIVVVQFSDFVQTGRDKRYNLTCIFREPGEAVVTSSYIGSARSGALIPIEYLPAENSLTSRVDLTILYQGRPTTTIAVGDPLTFRLEAHGGFNTATDIFATNVLARDPYSGRTVQLIDQYGCPVDNYVFPALDRSREGDGLEARFNAFKIPESNFLVFEATVRTCRDGCQPAYCNAPSGRSEPSFGRRRRRGIPDASIEGPPDNDTHDPETAHVVQEKKAATNKAEGSTDDEEQVREMFEVFESRFDMPEGSSGRSATEENSADVARLEALLESGDVVLSGAEFYALVSSLALLLLLLLCGSIAVGLAYRRYHPLLLKHSDDRSGESACSQQKPSFPNLSGLSAFISNKTSISRSGGMSPAAASTVTLPAISDNSMASSHPGRRGTFEDPSEPIYTDPSLFERPRSMRSLAPSTTGLTSVEY